MKVTIAGGDERMIYVARDLKEAGFEIAEFALNNSNLTMKEALKNSDIAVLPLPCEKGGILNAPTSNEQINVGAFIDSAEPSTLILGGNLPIANERLIDYAKREDFLLMNALATAEGAIEIALNELQITLHGANALILGFGRIGGMLLKLLNGFGASTTVAARRSESRTHAEIQGARAMDFNELYSLLPSFDVVFNTVPHKLLSYRELSSLKTSAVVIDLVSGEGGADKSTARELGIRLIHALALPGKTAPKSAGKAISKAILAILRERGMLE